MIRLIRDVYKAMFFGVIFITPFFAFGQDIKTHEKKYFLSDLIRDIKTKYKIMIAFDPKSIVNIESAPACAKVVDPITCLERMHGDIFEIIRTSDEKIMIRKRLENESVLIKSTIWDGTENLPLRYAEIQCAELNIFAVSDHDGIFSLEVPMSNQGWQDAIVTISYLGYQSQKRVLASLLAQEKVVLQPTMFLAPITKIHAIKPSLQTTNAEAAIEVQATLIDRLSSFSQGDVLRSLQVLPGISATNDLSSSVTFRGSNEDQNLVLIGNIPLYQTGHYYNLFSIVNDEPIESVKLYRNYFPAKFGEATGSILQLKPRSPIKEKLHVKADVSILTTDLSASIPVGEQFGISLSGRTTNGNIGKGSIGDFFSENASALTINQGEGELFNRALQPDVQFQDLLSNVHWKGKGGISFTSQLIYAKDKAMLSDMYTIRSRNNRAAATYNYESKQQWSNHGLGSKLTKEWNKSQTSQIEFYWTSFDRSDETESSLTRDRQAVDASKLDIVHFGLNDAIDDKSISFDQFVHMAKGRQVHFGYQYQMISVDYFVDRQKNDLEFVDRSSSIHSIFINTKLHSNTSAVKAELGWRTSYSTLADRMFFSPRMQLLGQLSDGIKWKSSLGYYNQQLRTINILSGNNAYKQVWTLSDNNEIPSMSTSSFMLGLKGVHRWFTVDVELYYNDDKNVMQELIPEQSNEFLQQLASLNPDLYIGKGRRYGVDVMIKRETSKHTSLLSYSLATSQTSFDGFNHGTWIAAADDRRHELNLNHIQYIGKFSACATIVFASANPQFEFNKNNQDDRLEAYGRNAPYQRADLGLDYDFSLGKCELRVGASVFNIFNHQNTASVRYAKVDQFQEQQRSSFFTETISLLDRTYNLRLQMTIK